MGLERNSSPGIERVKERERERERERESEREWFNSKKILIRPEEEHTTSDFLIYHPPFSVVLSSNRVSSPFCFIHLAFSFAPPSPPPVAPVDFLRVDSTSLIVVVTLSNVTSSISEERKHRAREIETFLANKEIIRTFEFFLFLFLSLSLSPL